MWIHLSPAHCQDGIRSLECLGDGVSVFCMGERNEYFWPKGREVGLLVNIPSVPFPSISKGWVYFPVLALGFIILFILANEILLGMTWAGTWKGLRRWACCLASAVATNKTWHGSRRMRGTQSWPGWLSLEAKPLLLTLRHRVRNPSCCMPLWYLCLLYSSSWLRQAPQLPERWELSK